LRDHGAVDIWVHSPSGRGEKFALKHGIGHTPADDFAATAAHADLIITCTSVEQPVVDAALLHAGGVDADTRRLVIDLGLPRNVDPDVATVPGVTLLDLETIRLHAPLEELQATDAARAVVTEAARRFTIVGDSRAVTPGVVAMREHVFSLMEAEIARARARGDDGRTEQSLRHLVGVLLHTPTARAHELAAEGRADEYLSALSTLFGIEVP